MADFSKIGRNNKNRGRAFEKRCAESLGWTRVPYSGGSSEWGGGDVVDGFYSKLGLWSAECKTQQRTSTLSLSIKDKWLRQMRRDCGGRQPVMFLKQVGDSNAFALLPHESFIFLKDRGTQHASKHFADYSRFDELMENCERNVVHLKTLGKGYGFCIPYEGYGCMGYLGMVKLIVRDTETNSSQVFYLMDFEDYSYMVRELKIMKVDKK